MVTERRRSPAASSTHPQETRSRPMAPPAAGMQQPGTVRWSTQPDVETPPLRAAEYMEGPPRACLVTHLGVFGQGEGRDSDADTDR